MKLPNAHVAIVEQAKVCEYLLNATHRFGASKARFFISFGFSLDAWEQLAVALKAHGAENDVVKVKETDFGARYEVEGKLQTPDGREPLVCSVWQVEAGGAASDHRVSNGGEGVIHEHDYIVLMQDLPEQGLQAGDVGTVVHVHAGNAAYEVEFMTLTGQTIAVATVSPSQLRPINSRDVSHVR